MVPTYRHSISSLMPLDLNHEDQNHELSSPNQYHSSSSFSSASLSYPLLLHPPDQDQEISYYSSQSKPLPNEEAEKIIPSSGSWDDSAAENQQSSHKRKLAVWKKDRSENLQVQAAAEPEGGGTSVKWMSSKMRMMRKMMVSDHQNKYEDDLKQPLSPLGTDTSSSNNNYSNHIIRVCSDCHTTKTPLWRSGPRGPKSLCNACGIRQRKARRAMAAAAAAGVNGTTVVAAETIVKRNKLLQKKENKSKIEFSSSTHMNKKKRKLVVGGKPISDDHSLKKLGFEDLRLSLSKSLALQQVFPQDEKEAAILLMALSYGLVHG